RHLCRFDLEFLMGLWVFQGPCTVRTVKRHKCRAPARSWTRLGTTRYSTLDTRHSTLSCMDIADYLSDDGQAMLALCSNLALPEESAGDGPAPFKLSEWNQLERQIQSSSLKSPNALRDCSAEKLRAELSLSQEEAERILLLLGRSGRLALELENLFSRGIWP